MKGERRRTGVVPFICAAIFLAAAHAAAAATTQCLTPAAEQALRELHATGRLATALGDDLTFVGVNVGATEIVLRAEDAAARQHGIRLTLRGASERTPDEGGRRFVFYLLPSDTPHEAAAVKALLATARLIDQTLPQAALADCSGRRGGEAQPPPSGISGPQHYSRTLALFSAIVQVLVLLAATVFGWRAIRPA